MRVVIKNQKDFAAGILFAAFGAAGFVWSFSYPMGTLLRMGPGYFPALAFGLLGLCGLVILIRSLRRPGEALERLAGRPLMVVLAAVLMYSLTVEKLGFVVSSFMLIVIACLAGARLTLFQVLALAVGMTLFCLFIFVVALGLPMPIWPDLSL